VQVFIVDDSPLVRQRLAELLLDVEDTRLVGEAATVAEALARIPVVHPDFVTLDIRMPDGDGVTVLSAVKRLDHPPLVGILTIFPSDLCRRRCIELGADYFWDKGRDLAEIPGVLRALARQLAET
jgi:DNA-binding NarL/FixJ family response regulator